MKLNAFRIKNYRSIIDTGWTRLAPDNITTLIGQNESGKTSILEGLNSFFHGKIYDDILRSDLTFPETSCSFILSPEEVERIQDENSFHPRVAEHMKESGSITLNRKWISKNDSILFYGDDTMLQEFREMEDRAKKLEEELIARVEHILNETARIIEIQNSEGQEKNNLRSELNGMHSRIEKLEKIIRRSRNEKKSESAKAELFELQKNEGLLKIKFDKIDASYRDKSEKLDALNRVSDYARRFTQARNANLDLQNEISAVTAKVNDIREVMLYTDDEKSIHQLNQKLRNLQAEIIEKQHVLEEYLNSYQFAKECFSLALENQEGDDIEVKAWKKLEELETGKLLEHAGEALFPYIPDFKLFEDFSSLLPNSIDLEDILNKDSQVEGYNAARNFLIVSGLDASFFQASNDRILKQKIENLNGEITLHFQGYWRQSLGKKNKIRLNFELEHYDFSHPVNKGKPYLEFWIKDEHERLYPKQRSRGVRWFLSFFLELKATALENNRKGKILLIDEPGLSLHARAQEDVLKVFEDLKENIQIIYSTHSPHLVNTNKIYRLLAVQRADQFDDRSETKVYDAQSLSNVSGDTLSPIYTLLGTQISESNFVRERNNIIVEDTAAFYYLKILHDIFAPEKQIYVLPATGISSVITLVNLLTGWKLGYGVLLTDTPESRKVKEELAENILTPLTKENENRICILEGFEGLEDLFSTIDFKKYVLGKRIGITENNLVYIKNNKLSRSSLATSFALMYQNIKLKPEDFDEESRENFKDLIRKVMDIAG